MKQVDIKIHKAYVFNEVRKASQYIGQRLVSEQDPGAFTRVGLTEADNLLLERLWQEGCELALQTVRRYLAAHEDTRTPGNGCDLSRDFQAQLAMPDGFDEHLVPGIESSLTSYIVTTMLAKWCMVADKQDAQAYMQLAEVALQDANRKLFKRNRPQRP